MLLRSKSTLRCVCESSSCPAPHHLAGTSCTCCMGSACAQASTWTPSCMLETGFVEYWAVRASPGSALQGWQACEPRERRRLPENSCCSATALPRRWQTSTGGPERERSPCVGRNSRMNSCSEHSRYPPSLNRLVDVCARRFWQRFRCNPALCLTGSGPAHVELFIGVIARLRSLPSCEPVSYMRLAAKLKARSARPPKETGQAASWVSS